jgi:hypothetical protein
VVALVTSFWRRPLIASSSDFLVAASAMIELLLSFSAAFARAISAFNALVIVSSLSFLVLASALIAASSLASSYVALDNSAASAALRAVVSSSIL